ncbi:fructosamine kinase family protein [Chamaesiphon sp. OTE_8_metabat_110]|uniref:fructosamine kinase family protein n=1 Tax=Chamaesiphon sp. OTE_8_metabat_110 TaxID=2964696 RepID=UPI00286A63A1|nr:fructosamine kinase family protein [Chamaesiphon sp. OTE_8_metabat_110]
MSANIQWREISAQITRATGEPFEISDRQSLSGGCINQVYLISSRDRDRYLIKLNRAALIEMFVAEATGLSEIAATATIRVPVPICWGTVGEHSYLVMEYLDLVTNAAVGGASPKENRSWREMGRNLARLHQYRSERQQFGWQIDNTIGSTPQINTWNSDWATFFTNNRIGYQLQLARQRGGNFPQATALLAAIPRLLADYQPPPALVHGDLWSGNTSFTTTGTPVIFDPATHWGDREVDLALTELFGGFPAAFYQGYDEIYPLDPGYSQRKNLYNLYHILNHYNLFGGSYQAQANRTIGILLRLA